MAGRLSGLRLMQDTRRVMRADGFGSFGMRGFWITSTGKALCGTGIVSRKKEYKSISLNIRINGETKTNMLVGLKYALASAAIATIIIGLSGPSRSADSSRQERHTATSTVTAAVTAPASQSIGGLESPDPCTLPYVECETDEKADILKKVCEEEGFENNCWKTLYGMMMVESRGNTDTVGDGGRSYGPFQIQVRMHNVSIPCAKDIECAAQWTLKRMIANGYPTFRSYSIRRHNGSGPLTATYLQRVNQAALSLK